MRHADHIGIGIQRKLGLLIPRLFSQFIYILEKNKKLEYINSSIVASMDFLIIWICYLGFRDVFGHRKGLNCCLIGNLVGLSKGS